MRDQEQPLVPPPPTWSEWLPPKVTPREAITNFWSKAFTYSGRATRAEYNWALGVFLVSYVALGAFVVGAGLRDSIIGVVIVLSYLVAFLVPWFALIARRCHDMNRAGAFGFLLLATGIGFLVTEGYLIFGDSDPRGVRFDAPSPPQ